MTAPSITLPKITSDKPPNETKIRKSYPGWMIFFIIFIAFEAGTQYWRSYQIGKLQDEVSDLKWRMEIFEHSTLQSRHKRQVEPTNNLFEDGAAIQAGRYDGRDDQNQDTEGLRIYDAWFQHRNSNHIPQRSRTGSSSGKIKSDEKGIKPYHRTSAAWVEKSRSSDHDLNAHFEEKVFRDKYPKRRSKVKKNRAIDMPHTNFYKMTPTEAPKVEEARPLRRSTSAPRSSPISQLPIINQRNATKTRYKSNRDLVRSGGGHRRHHQHQKPVRNQMDNEVTSLIDELDGLKAIHYVGEKSKTEHNRRVYEGEGNQRNQDGVFRHWAPARWATRMRATQNFPMDDEGRVSVKKSGLYYIYAQVNYLDEHDVNAFQVYVNEDAYLLCTVMTHTRHSTTKANTCFTSGVAFLEAEDQILIRDLEPMRDSVIRPAHTFFGLIQLSSN